MLAMSRGIASESIFFYITLSALQTLRQVFPLPQPSLSSHPILTSPKMPSLTLQFLLLTQILLTNANGLAELTLREVLFPRSSLISSAINIFNNKRSIEARQDPEACGLVLDAISICESFSPGFLTYAPSRQAPCLCYSSSTWMPEVFDGAISTCNIFRLL